LGVDRGVAAMDAYRQAAPIIDGDKIDWQRYLQPEDRARVIPAEALAEEGMRRMAMGTEAEVGLSLPWQKTHATVRLRPGKVAVWAGWTHHGKTAMLKQLMLYGIQHGEKPLIASMEEEVLDVWEDLGKMACGREDPSIREGKRFVEFIRAKLWLYDQQGLITPRKMCAVIRYAAAELKITQAVVDSLMMLAVDRDDYEAQARFIGELKAVAKDTGVTVHLVAHMRKRDGKGGDESPGTIHDIAGGHEIASKADYVFIPWRDKRPAEKRGTDPACILKVDKQRGRRNWLGNVGLHYHVGAKQFVEDVHPMRFWNDQGEDF
jgi:twinkle protein